MRIRFTYIDDGLTAPELDAAVPFEAVLLRRLPGPDRPDYWIAELDHPIRWSGRDVFHLIVTPAWENRDLSPGATKVPLKIAYVTDLSLLTDTSLSFDKVALPAALGTADVLRAKPRALWT